jgi:hypothetical protein
MINQVKAFLAIVAVACVVPAAGLAIEAYSQDFEGLDQGSLSALGDDGWLVFANVFSPGGDYLYGYGVFPAPNNPDAPAFSLIVTGQGGPEQGAQQLSVFSDYNNGDHAVGNLIESLVFQEQMIDAGAVDQTWIFAFQAKRGNIEGETTAVAFIKTLDPGSGFQTTNFITADMTAIGELWSEYSLSITIDAGLVGQLLQIGFASTASNYEGSGIFYDNIDFFLSDPTSIESTSWSQVKSIFQ